MPASRAARDERRLLNRLRQDLVTTFPAALAITGEDLARPTFLRMLERWPTREALAVASHDELNGFARECRCAWPERLVERVQQAMAHDHFAPKDYLVRAKADTIRLAPPNCSLSASREGLGSGAWGSSSSGRRDEGAPSNRVRTSGGRAFLTARST